MGSEVIEVTDILVAGNSRADWFSRRIIMECLPQISSTLFLSIVSDHMRTTLTLEIPRNVVSYFEWRHSVQDCGTHSLITRETWMECIQHYSHHSASWRSSTVKYWVICMRNGRQIRVTYMSRTHTWVLGDGRQHYMYIISYWLVPLSHDLRL